MAILEATTNKLLDELHAARAESDKLFGILRPEAIYQRPIAERHRVIFYIGHLDGFDSIQICRDALGMKAPDSEFDSLFQAGIDPDSAHLPADQPGDWPSLEQVYAYVQRCRRSVDENIDRVSEDVAYMALEHRLMHLETLAYMFHNFDTALKIAPETKERTAAGERGIQNDWRFVPEGQAILGKSRGDGFGWDNEYDECHTQVGKFRIQRYPITNGEYLEFVNEGGTIPHFWMERGGALYHRGMLEAIPLPLDWPVYVTKDQADAYARWLGKALPTEEEFHRAAYGVPHGRQRPYPWGSKKPSHAQGNFDFQCWDPLPVDATPAGDSAYAVSQLVGNGWEWTSTPFQPFPGFSPRDTYPGYSANFFDHEHYVLKGGSARTAARLLRRSFRNWFRHDYPYLYAKFRCVER